MIRGLFKLSRTGVVFGLKKYYKDKTVKTLYAVSIGWGVFQLLIGGNRAKVGEQIEGLLLVMLIIGYLGWLDAKGITFRLNMFYRELVSATKIFSYNKPR